MRFKRLTKYEEDKKIKRLEWLGYLGSMKKLRTVQNIAWTYPGGKIKKERSKERWGEAMMQDIRNK